MTRTRMAVAAAGLLVGISAALAAQAPAITRTMLNRADLTQAGREAVTARADFPVGGSTGKHTHPGDEVTYVLEGAVTLDVEGMAPRMVKAGEVLFIAAGKPHNVTAAGGAKAVAIANYLVEKGKPLATPVP